jgi:hypothetical protein
VKFLLFTWFFQTQFFFYAVFKVLARFFIQHSLCSSSDKVLSVFSIGDFVSGGGKRTRTADILLAKQALYQLSYTPNFF